MPNIKPIALDGSTLEGGGQLTRVALSLSAICNIPISIHDIRANRAPKSSYYKASSNHSKHARNDQATSRTRHAASKRSSKVEGGLKESHLAALQWLAAQCDAHVEGAEVGSREITFIPGAGGQNTTKKSKGAAASDLVNLDSNTITLRNPGSVWLIFQALYPFIVFGYPRHFQAPQPNANGPSMGEQAKTDVLRLTLRGGTNVSKSMSGEYVQQVFLPLCERIGLPSTDIEIVKRGWAGNAPQIGEVEVRVQRPQNFSLPASSVTDRGEISKVSVTVIAHPEDTRRRLVEVLQGCIVEHFGEDVEIAVPVDEDSEDPRRMYLLLVAQTANNWRLGRDYLGTGKTPKNDAELGRMIDVSCQTVTRGLKTEVKRGGCVDEFMQDQLVVFQALAEGKSTVDGGLWKENNHTHHGDEECGDGEGSLHTRTVRWVCERMLGKRGVAFRLGGECVRTGCNVEGGVEGLEETLGEFELEDDG